MAGPAVTLPRPDVAAADAREALPPAGPFGLYWHGRQKFIWKSAFLAATTLALVPILLSKHALAAQLYVAFLVVVHLAGLAIFAYGVRKHDIAPTRRGLVMRVVGLAFFAVLLAVASKGLADPTAGLVFWGSLGGIWFLHALGLLLLHVRTPGEQSKCPFF